MTFTRRHMLFVDGTNLLMQLKEELKIDFRADRPPLSALRIANRIVTDTPVQIPGAILVIRRYWFGSYQGSEEYHQELCSALRTLNYEPVLFQRRKGREKGVDIALTKEMLVNAFNQNFDVGRLVAGDEDYVGLVNEVKRYGQIVVGSFFENSLAPALLLSFDSFTPLDERLHAPGPSIEGFIAELKQEI